MLELLSAFSVEQIIIYTVMLALAIKGAVDFFSWCKEKYQERFNKDYKKKKDTELLVEHYTKCSEQHQESMECYANLNKKIDDLTTNIDARFSDIEKQVGQLVGSDQHDIKGWIVEKHHTLMKQEWVDDFTMDTLEKRFSDYVLEGGNSYIESLMNELRALPHFPKE